jgi:hypothetical protein
VAARRVKQDDTLAGDAKVDAGTQLKSHDCLPK